MAGVRPVRSTIIGIVREFTWCNITAGIVNKYADFIIIFSYSLNLGAFQGLSSGLHNALAGANLPTNPAAAAAAWPYGALQVYTTF